MCGALARTEGILISGGSDFHGSNQASDLSWHMEEENLKISYDILTNLREARKK